MRTMPLLAIGLLLSVSACGVADRGSEETAPQTVVVTTTVPKSAASASTVGSSHSPTPTAAGSPASDAEPNTAHGPAGISPGEFDALLHANPHKGDSVHLGGQDYEVCAYGDGYGMYLVLAGANTSCDFALNLFKSQTSGLNASKDPIRRNFKSNLPVTSPVTGEKYDVSCRLENNNALACEGGEGASIVLF